MKFSVLWTAGLCAWLFVTMSAPAGALPGC